MKAVISAVLAVFFVGLVFAISWKYFDLTRLPSTIQPQPPAQNAVNFTRIDALAFDTTSNAILVATPEGAFGYDAPTGWTLRNAQFGFSALALIGSGTYLASGHPTTQPLVNSGLLVSQDRGVSWRVLNSINTDIRTLLAIPDTNIVIARPASTAEGLLISLDNGRTFQKFDAQGLPQPTTSISGGINNGQVLLLAGTFDGAYLSNSEGSFWQRVVKLPQMLIATVAVAPRNPNYMLVAGIDDVYVSDNASEEWHKIAVAPAPDKHVVAAAFSFGDPPFLAVAIGDGLVYITPDNGQTWTTTFK